jgi:hypothetical protein
MFLKRTQESCVEGVEVKYHCIINIATGVEYNEILNLEGEELEVTQKRVIRGGNRY